MEKWLKWAMELESIAKCGLVYCVNDYDKERYAQIEAIAQDMMSYKSGIKPEVIKDLFSKEPGYITPKTDVRGVIFDNDKILMVQEKNGQWTLPGGWADVNLSVKENVVKECKEETGLVVEPVRILAIHDRNRHNLPVYAYSVYKYFVLCAVVGGEFEQNTETLQTAYFSIENIPDNLAGEKVSYEQIKMCFEAVHNPQWEVYFD